MYVTNNDTAAPISLSPPRALENVEARMRWVGGWTSWTPKRHPQLFMPYLAYVAGTGGCGFARVRHASAWKTWKTKLF